MQTCRNKRKLLSILPVPSTTDANGSSAMDTSNPVSSRIRLSKFLSNAPPPVNTMPRSLMSAESSGGVRSSATRTAFTIVATHSVQGLADFAVIDGNRARHTLDQVAPLHFHGERFFQRIGGTDLYFDLFCGALAHQ